MNLYFRRLWIYLSALFAGNRTPLMQTHVRHYRVWLTDQDMFMHMTNSRYLSFSDLGRLNLLLRTGLHRSFQKQGWSLEICAQTRTITRMLKSPQSFELSCEIVGWTDNFIAFRHLFKRAQKTHAEVNSIMRITDASDHPVPIDTVLASIDSLSPSPDLPELFRDLIQQSERALDRTG
jgi:acyl-CoA thioesterase FadM